MPRKPTVRIGCATAWSGDRFEPASVLVREGDLDYLFFETMSEATMSLAQIRRAAEPSLPAYDPLLEPRLRPILRDCVERSITIVSNQGWLDPAGAAEAVAGLARDEGLPGLRVAAIVSPPVALDHLRLVETGEEVAGRLPDVVSAEVYLGAWPIVEALARGADVVLTPRVTDASLVLGPLAYELGWGPSDLGQLARGVVLGHLLECSAQVTGGGLADPGYTDVPGLADLGHPIAEVDATGAIVTKVDGTGGFVTTATCKSQLLYEVGDPARYLNPDVVADFTTVRFEEVARDRVAVAGGRGLAAPDTYKVLLGIREGFLAEEVMVYAGPGALDRARLAETVVRERLERMELLADDLRFDYVGLDAVHREATPPGAPVPYEVAVRVAARTGERRDAEKLAAAVAPMAVAGPAGTGKWGTLGAPRVRPVVGMYSTLVPKEAVETRVELVTA